MSNRITLTALFSLSLILFFASIEPFQIAGIFLIIFYLPGLSIFCLFRKENLTFEDITLAFHCSIGISGLVTVGALFLGVHVKNVAFIIYGLVCLAVLAHLISRRKTKVRLSLAIERREVLFMMFSLFMVLVLSIPYFTGPNRGFVAAHAYHHSSFVSQLLHGIFPPENPGLGGTVIGYYWGFHALIAVVASQTDFHHFQIIFALNAVSLFAIFCMSYSFAKAYDMSERYRYMMPLAVLGLMRFDIGLYFIAKVLPGILHSPEDFVTAHDFSPMEVIGIWLKGLPWYDTRLFFMNKFYNISAMPAAIGLCFAYLLIQLLLVKKGLSDKVYLIGLSVILSASILMYPPLAVVPLLHGTIWSLYIFISTKGNFREKTKETLLLFVPYALGLVIVLPYLLFIMASRDISSSSQGRVFQFAFYQQSVKNLIVFLIPSPFILYGVWAAFRKLSYTREFFFLFIGAGLSILLSLFTRWPFNNSYKFNYILIIFLAFFFVLAMAHGCHSLSLRRITRAVLAIVTLLLILNPILVESAYIVSCLSMERYVSYSNGHIVYAHDKQKNEAYAWIRENTPVNALIMLGHTETNWPCCGLNNNYEPAAFSERTLYVIKDEDYTVSNPEFSKRIHFREKLFEDPDDEEVIDFFSSLNRPVYLLIDESLDEKKFYVEDRFKQFPLNPGKEFLLVFQNERQRVYQIRFSK